jgi:hypothetical protein
MNGGQFVSNGQIITHGRCQTHGLIKFILKDELDPDTEMTMGEFIDKKIEAREI